ncbi:hypothetical protein [Prochlorococcus sp. MIT 0801]|uniref:hypothetical protein n=1 Tax=Prochlorococcus sp. MIT 0801 TaxID=1501269 RepID=UPI000570E1DF|nr:hypothetical protein [Prochlorococcus sp. MIT 0801]
MKSILFVSIILLTFTGTAYSYPESQMDDCVSSALSNPATKSISENAITNYCDCALKAIIDDNKDIRESGYECAQQNFN